MSLLRYMIEVTFAIVVRFVILMLSFQNFCNFVMQRELFPLIPK